MLQAHGVSPELAQETLYEGGISGPEEKGQDILKVLWRWKWSAILGASIGLTCGYLHYARQEPTYQSTALVQVVYPSSEAAGLETLEGPEGARGPSRLDESLIIKSARVIDLAIDHGRLASLEFLSDKSPDEIRGWILESKRLVVEPADRDNSTTLIELSFVCEDAQLSQAVVDAIIAGYDDYLEQAYNSLGNEVVRVVGQAQKSLRASYEGLSAKHALFRKEAPMIWLGDEARNQFAENSVEINSSINQIQIETRKLEATLQHIAEVERQERPIDAILLMLASDSGLKESLLDDEASAELSGSPDGPRASEKLPFSSAERRAVLMELQIREQELLDTVGEGHPSVASIRRKIMLLDEQIIALADSEKRMEAEQDSLTSRGALAEATPEERLQLWKSSLQERLATLGRQEGLLRELAEDNEIKSKELQEYLTKNRLLNSELASVQQLLDGYTSTLNRIQILPQSSRRTLETLTPPVAGEFYGPSLLPYLFGGASVGFLVIAGLAIVVDWLDKSFRSPEEISAALGLSILGHVPQMSLKQSASKRTAFDQALCTVTGSCQAANESFRSVRTGLYFSETGGGSRVIQVTSPVPGDGKSTVSANLAISIAQSGRSVLLVDADLRRPRIAKLFGSQKESGLGEVIQGTASLQDAIFTTPVPNLAVLAGPKQIGNPAELLSHQRFVDILDEVREAYDYVIVDTPPVLAVADASAVAARVDGVVLTIRLRRDTRPTALQTAKVLEAVGARSLGVVVNGVTGRGYRYHYGKYGNYGYGGSEPRAVLHKPQRTTQTRQSEELTSSGT